MNVLRCLMCGTRTEEAYCEDCREEISKED